jgi:5-methylcytosine-specific restriction endonuclease McrA
VSDHPPLYPDRKPIPDDVREAVLKRANGNCENCGRDNTPLEMHHLRYVIRHSHKWEEEVFGKETPDDLQALCRNCHLGKHTVQGVFFADPEEAESERDYLDHMWGKDD